MYTSAPTTTHGLAMFPSAPSSNTAPARSDGPNLTMFLLAHRAYRREFARLAMAAETVTNAKPQRAAAIEQHIALVARSLHIHHTGEDARIWPLLRERDPAAAVLLDTLEREHENIDPLLAAVADRSVPLRRRAAVLDELSTAIDAHLTREEAEAVPLIRRYFTAAEWEADSKAHLKEARPELPIFTCVLIDHMTEPEVAGLMANGPKPLVLLYKISWRRRWEKRRKLVYGA